MGRRGPRPVSHRGPRPVSHKGPRPVSHRVPRPVSHRDPRPVGHRDPRPVGHRVPRPVSHRVPRPVGHRDRRPVSHRDRRPVGHRDRRPAARGGTGRPADTGHPRPRRRARLRFPAAAAPPARRRGRTEPGPAAPGCSPGRGRRHGSRRHGSRRHGSRRHGNRSHWSRRHRDRRDRRAAPGNPAQARLPRDRAGGYAPGEEAGRRHPKGCLSYSPFPSELGGRHAGQNGKMAYAPDRAILPSGRLIRPVIQSRRSSGRPPLRRDRFARSSPKVTGSIRASWRP